MRSRSTGMPWLIYGTGALAKQSVASAAIAKLPIILAGRAQDSIVPLAQSAGLEYRVADIQDDLSQLLVGIAGLINLAGPYCHTAPWLIDACVKVGIDYIDASNELDTHQVAWSVRDLAQAQGCAVVPGVGVGTWLSECLVHALIDYSSCKPESASVYLLSSGSARKTEGVMASEHRVIYKPGLVRASNVERHVRGIARVRPLPEWTGHKSGLVIASGDIHALGLSTSLQNVTVMAAINAAPCAVRAALPMTVLNARRRARYRRRSASATDGRADNGSLSTKLMAEITGHSGDTLRGRLLTGSGTMLAAQAVIQAARELSDGSFAGTQTAFQVLGMSMHRDAMDYKIELI